MNTFTGSSILPLALVLTLAACASPPKATPSEPAPAARQLAAGEGAWPKSVVWFQTAAERKALFEQTYRLARERLPELIGDRQPGSWAVVLDADETVIDNTVYQLRLWRSTRPFNASDWNGWVRERAAPELPGARDFIREVRERGGKAIIVTNREESVCEATRDNFDRLGIAIDGMLCKQGDVRDKNPRFRSIVTGTSSLGLPPLAVVAYVGDNIQDFPDRTQAQPGSNRQFGGDQFILPNPMYGSWENNPVREP